MELDWIGCDARVSEAAVEVDEKKKGNKSFLGGGVGEAPATAVR